MYMMYIQHCELIRWATRWGDPQAKKRRWNVVPKIVGEKHPSIWPAGSDDREGPCAICWGCLERSGVCWVLHEVSAFEQYDKLGVNMFEFSDLEKNHPSSFLFTKAPRSLSCFHRTRKHFFNTAPFNQLGQGNSQVEAREVRKPKFACHVGEKMNTWTLQKRYLPKESQRCTLEGKSSWRLAKYVVHPERWKDTVLP